MDEHDKEILREAKNWRPNLSTPRQPETELCIHWMGCLFKIIDRLDKQVAEIVEAGESFRLIFQAFEDSDLRITNSAIILVEEQDGEPMATTLLWGNIRRLAQALEGVKDE